MERVEAHPHHRQARRLLRWHAEVAHLHRRHSRGQEDRDIQRQETIRTILNTQQTPMTKKILLLLTAFASLPLWAQDDAPQRASEKGAEYDA